MLSHGVQVILVLVLKFHIFSRIQVFPSVMHFRIILLRLVLLLILLRGLAF